MKTKLTLLTTFTLFMIYFSANAQVSVNVNINTLPDWAPAQYVPETRYYYIPELEVYYDIPSKMYIYPHKKGWVRNKKLPKHYAKHNLNKCYKVSLYDIGPNPYAYHNSHKVKYPKNFNRGKHQPTRIEHHKPGPGHHPKHETHKPGHKKQDEKKAFNHKPNSPKHEPKHEERRAFRH
jgi:hypothetical protein